LQLTAIRGIDGKLVPTAGHSSGSVQ